MVALEEDGYIHRPHVSAGGVPLDRGYRQFVSYLDPDVELDPVSAALTNAFCEIRSMAITRLHPVND